MAFLYVPVGDGSDHKAIIGKSGQLRDFLIIGIQEMQAPWMKTISGYRFSRPRASAA